MSSVRQDNERVIRSGVRLAIDSIADFLDLIRQALTKTTTTTIAIEFEPNMEMDITALQVFCSGCKSAAAQGKRFIHRGRLPQTLLALLAAAGAEHLKPCCNNNKWTCS